MNASSPSRLVPAIEAQVQGFFDPRTATISYVVADPQSGCCAVVDPVLDFEPRLGCTSDRSVERLVAHIQHQGFHLSWILETHVHADHLSGAALLQQRLGGEIVIGEHVCTVQEKFAHLFDCGSEMAIDGSQFDRLVTDRDQLELGSLMIDVLHTPGHTPACVSYLVSNAVFVGDTLFMPDYGTARTDFPGGDAHQLYRSIRKILSLPRETRMFVCHDYQPGGREPAWETSVDAQRRGNTAIHDGVQEADFVRQRQARDAQLSAPELILPATQVNIRAGHLPAAAANGVRYLKIPLNQLELCAAGADP